MNFIRILSGFAGHEFIVKELKAEFYGSLLILKSFAHFCCDLLQSGLEFMGVKNGVFLLVQTNNTYIFASQLKMSEHS
jgi:hypothetical protein